MPVPYDKPTLDQIMYSLKVSGEAGDVLCTHAAEEIERLQRLAFAAPELLAVAKLAFDYAQDTKARFIDHWDGEDAESYGKLCDAIDAAIDKAEGCEVSEQVWEFTFKCVQAAESRDEALAAALEYLAEYADKGELCPTDSKLLEEGDYDAVQ